MRRLSEGSHRSGIGRWMDGLIRYVSRRDNILSRISGVPFLQQMIRQVTGRAGAFMWMSFA
ncbi:MAG: hypothetical protein VX988_12790 [Planctomycetota bacterium]|nr:hypothetical protein [Planctomycetota bacterium]